MPNKYFVKIPYSYVRYGTLSCYIFADSESDAEEAASDYNERHSEDYDDSDSDGDTEYNYSDMEIELEEEDVNSPDSNSNNSNLPFSNVPSYFLAELQQL